MKFEAVRVEAEGRERQRAEACCRVEVQTNRAILAPEGGEGAFEIMLPLQEAVEATTDVLQIRRTAL